MSQIGWVVLALVETSVGAMFAWAAVLVLVESGGPILAERKSDGGTPWHPHHIAERYGLMVIITLGEGLLGTTVALLAVIGPDGPGWSTSLVLLGVSGHGADVRDVVDLLRGAERAAAARRTGNARSAGATATSRCSARRSPSAPACTSRRTTSSTTPTSSAVGTLATVAVPLAVYFVMLFVLYMQISRTFDPFHVVLFAITVA